MRNTKKFVSVILSLAVLLSSVYVGGIATFAAESSLTKIVNTYDDAGTVFTTVPCERETASTRTVNGVTDKYEFSVWFATVEKDSTYNGTEQNAVRFSKAKAYNDEWPAVVKLYDNNASGLTQFKPKANTSYSISLRYNSVVKPSSKVQLQLRQRNTTDPKTRHTYNESEVILPSIVSVSNATNGWQEVKTTFTTGDNPANLYLCLSSATTSWVSTVDFWVDDIVIEELYNVTVCNYNPGENKVVGLAQGSLVSDFTVPTISGYRFGGVYSDAAFTNRLPADTCLDIMSGGTVYFKWDVLSTAKQYCGFEKYTIMNCLPYNTNVAEIVSSPVYLGSKAMKLALGEKGITAFEVRDSDAIIIERNTEYEISFAYKTDAAIEISAGIGKATDTCGTAVASSTIAVPASDAWQTATIRMTAAKGTDDSYALAILVYAENGATVYFDDILVTDLSEKEIVTMPNVSLNTYPTLDVFSKDIWDGSIAKSLTGEGTSESPYLISNGAELAYAILGGGNDAYYKLTKDIYLNDLDLVNWETGETVGEYVINPWYSNNANKNSGFSGTIDGDGHTIFGLYYTNGAPDANAQFGYGSSALIPRVNIGQTVNITKLGIENAYISVKTTYCASAFVGFAGPTQYQPESTVNGYATVNIDQCYAGKNVLLTANNVGVFLGGNYFGNLTVTNSYSLAKPVAVGVAPKFGFYGGRWESLISFKNCFSGYSNDEVIGVISNEWVQYIDNACANNYATGYTDIHHSAGKITNFAEFRSVNKMMGLDVFTNSSKMPKLNTNNVYTATEGYPVLTAFVGKSNVSTSTDTITVWNGTVSETLTGGGTAESPYLIQNGGDLAYAITSGGGNDKYYKLTADIYLNDFTDANWYTGHRYDQNLNIWYANTPFAGTLDGDGHVIYGLYYRDDDVYSTAGWGYYGVGLIPRVNRGNTVTIKNLGMDYAYIANRNAASAFVGFTGSTGYADQGEPYATLNMDRCYAGATVMIVGHDIGTFRGGSRYGNTTITNCYSLASFDPTEMNGGTGYTYGLVGNMYDSDATITNGFNANGPISSERSNFKRTNCYETVKSTYGDAKFISRSNMVGGDVFTNNSKMPNLAGGAFVPAYNTKLNDYYIYLPAGTMFEERYDVNCFDSFFVPLSNDDVINKAGIMTRGAFISFNEFPDTSKVIIPTETYEFVRYGTRLDLSADTTYYEDRMNVIRGTLDDLPKGAVNYMFITDMHYPYGPYYLTQALQNQVKLMVKTANEDDSIDFICIGGDSINGNQNKIENLKLLNAIFTPLLDCQKPVLIIAGNHDDGGWQSTFDMSQMFSDLDWTNWIINRYVNRTLEDGTEVKVVQDDKVDYSKYYYYDIKNKNTRVIVLDSIDYGMEYDENGTVTALEILDETKPQSSIERYKTGYTYWGYSKEQLKWFADKALGELPEGYDVVLLNHMGIDNTTSGADYLSVELRGIISAYQYKTAYVNNDFNINVDYSAEEGRIISYEFGHTHSDKLYHSEDIDLVQVNTGLSNAYTIKNGTRVFQSETEAQLDVMSVSRDVVYKMSVGNAGRSLKIYCARKTVKGDVNTDNTVDIRDLVYLRMIENGEAPMTTTADIERNGTCSDSYRYVRSMLIGDYVDAPVEIPSVSLNKSNYTPSSVTLTIYDADSYGVTWQTKKAPFIPVVQVSKGDTFDPNNYIEFKASFTKQQGYNANGSSYNYFVSKAVISGLEAGATYTYRCYDKYADVASESYTFTK